MKRVFAMAILLSGCTGAPPEPSRVPSPAPRPAPVPELPPPAAQTWSAPAYLVEPVRGLGLFPEEQHAAQRALARWANTQGIAVAPVDAVEARFRAYGLGQDDVGQACGRPLPRWTARQRYAAELGLVGRLNSRVSCGDAGCFLTVTQYDGVDFRAVVSKRWSTPYSGGVPVESLVAALSPAKASPGAGGMGVLGALSGGEIKERPERLVVRAYETRPDAKSKDVPINPTDRPSLQRCLATGASAELLLLVGQGGHAERCAPREHDSEAARCACGALVSQLPLPGLPAGARIHVSIRHEPGDVRAADRHVVRGYTQTHIKRDPDHERRFIPNVSHASIEQWQPPPFSTVARCFAGRAEAKSDRFLIDTYFGARGEVREVVIRKGAERLSRDEATCVERAFHRASAPCPAVPRTGARAMLHIDLRKIGAPRPSLKKLLENSFDEVPAAKPAKKK